MRKREYELRVGVRTSSSFNYGTIAIITARWPKQAIKEAEHLLSNREFTCADLVFYRRQQNPAILDQFFVHASEIRYKVLKTWGDLSGAKSLPIGTIG